MSISLQYGQLHKGRGYVFFDHSFFPARCTVPGMQQAFYWLLTGERLVRPHGIIQSLIIIFLKNTYVGKHSGYTVRRKKLPQTHIYMVSIFYACAWVVCLCKCVILAGIPCVISSSELYHRGQISGTSFFIDWSLLVYRNICFLLTKCII